MIFQSRGGNATNHSRVDPVSVLLSRVYEQFVSKFTGTVLSNNDRGLGCTITLQRSTASLFSGCTLQIDYCEGCPQPGLAKQSNNATTMTLITAVQITSWLMPSDPQLRYREDGGSPCKPLLTSRHIPHLAPWPE